MSEPKAAHDHADLEASLEFLKRTRAELRSLRWARIYRDRLQIIDLNRDYFDLRGVGYPDGDIVPLLRAINAAFNPETLHHPPPSEYREVDTGRRHRWAEDRVM